MESRWAGPGARMGATLMTMVMGWAPGEGSGLRRRADGQPEGRAARFLDRLAQPCGRGMALHALGLGEDTVELP